MDLYAHINGVDYALAIGVPLTDNLGEELDSMSINIPHVPGLDLKPYDDLIVHNYKPTYNEDGTFRYTNLPNRNYSEALDDRYEMIGGRRYKSSERHFYRHFIVDSYQRQQVDNVRKMYNYSVELISETKLLEKYLLPNRTITNPLNKPGKTVAWMANHFCNRYSGRIKVNNSLSNSPNTWKYAPRIVVSGFEKNDDLVANNQEVASLLGVETIGDRFGNIRCFETSFNNPNLREVLTKMFQASNCIPYIRDGVLFCVDLKKKRSKIEDIPGLIWDIESMNGGDYVDRLRKNYSSALTGRGGTKFHEFVGFRNINSATMKLESLKVETKYPIYLIDKFYICFYSAKMNGKMVKYDFTSFVLPSTTRALLSNDYVYFNNHQPQTINGYVDVNGNYVLGLCDYRFMTIEYGIGSKEITGFGDFVQYTENGITHNKKCVLENVLNVMLSSEYGSRVVEENITSEGDPNKAHFLSLAGLDKSEVYTDVLAPKPSAEWLSLVVANTSKYLFGDIGDSNEEGGYVGDNTLAMKNIFFEIEYQAQISSAVIVGKDNHDGEIMSPDSQQESLAITEQDGAVSEVKANRLGNKTRVITARVPYGKGSNEWDRFLVKVGQCSDEYGICYKRVITLNIDFISATYYFCKDYVLMNYYTSVFAKYRSSAYASIGESVSREENQYFSLLISRDTALRCDTNQTNGGDNSQERWKDWKGFDGNEYVYGYDFNLPPELVIGIFTPTKDNEKSLAIYSMDAPKQDIYFYNETKDFQKEYQYFVSDRAQYMSGNSLCLSFGMSDSVTAGTYIRQMYPDLSKVTLDALGLTKQESSNISSYGQYITYDSPITEITGTMQNYLSLPLSKADGSVSGIKFSLCENQKNVQGKAYNEDVKENSQETIDGIYNNDLYKLPRVSSDIATDDSLEKCHISVYEDYKDSKEIISETFQIDPVSDNEAVAISPYFMKMSPLAGGMIEKRFLKNAEDDSDFPLLVFSDSIYSNVASVGYTMHSFGIYTEAGDLSLKAFSKLLNKNIDKEITTQFSGVAEYVGTDLAVTIHKITRIDEYLRYIVVEMSFQSNVSVGVSSVTWKNLKKVSANRVKVVWWNANLIDSPLQEIRSLVDQETGIPDVDNYYPDFKETENGRERYIYNDIYHWNSQGSAPENKKYATFFKSTQNRLCFVFNMASFPNFQSSMQYDGEAEVSGVGSNIWNPTYGYVFGGTGGNAELAQPVLHVRCYTWFAGPFGKTPANWNKEALQCKLADGSGDKSYLQTVLWIATKTKIGSSFDQNISYDQETLTRLTLSRRIKPFPFYQRYTSDDLNNRIEAVSGSFYITGGPDSYNVREMAIDVHSRSESKIGDYSSIMCFIMDNDGLYHFAFGTNINTNGKPDSSSMVLSSVSFYVSIVPDRSRTVYDEGNMEPKYRTANYVNGDDMALVDPRGSNGCVPKDGFGAVGKI